MASSPPLSELQGWLRKVWTAPDGIDEALKSEEGKRAGLWIVDAPPLPARERLAVYADAYFLRLLESLGGDFPAVKRALGEEGFRRLVADYLRENPSDSPNVSDLGSRLPAFARSHALAKRFPYLPDLCRLEWEVLSALYTDRLPSLDPAVFAKLSAADWEKAKLVFDPTLRLFEVSWPVDRLWAQRAKPAKAARCVWRTTRPSWLAVYRDDEWVKVETLEERAFATLKRLMNGGGLSEACSASGAETDEIQAWFSAWARDGLVKGLRLQE
ncbi:MAG: putative DNA-binding domain-containing protein [Elusimicrobia bacterium]|nr:putative DNA-binding domain-containing protein [Elusimicrobiota bacterium]